MPSTAQPAPETDEKKSRGLGSYVVWAFVAVIVYVLSAGPVAYVEYRQKLGNTGPWRIVGYFYIPWTFAYERTPFHTPLGLYMHLWVPEIWNKNGNYIYSLLGT
jgi:hypothetical protein